MQYAISSLLELGRPSLLTRQGYLLKQILVVAFLDAQDEVVAVFLYLADMRSIGA